jgi:hypothetical protein
VHRLRFPARRVLGPHSVHGLPHAGTGVSAVRGEQSGAGRIPLLQTQVPDFLHRLTNTQTVPFHAFVTTNRDLKQLYFTVLTRFSAEELQQQLDGLRRLEEESAAHLSKQRNLERIERRRAMSAKHKVPTSCSGDAEECGQEPPMADGEVAESKGEECSAAAETGESAAINHSKQRRRTLRKQIDRIAELLKLRAEEAMTGEATGAVPAEVANPKTRGGWGFWKS